MEDWIFQWKLRALNGRKDYEENKDLSGPIQVRIEDRLSKGFNSAHLTVIEDFCGYCQG